MNSLEEQPQLADQAPEFLHRQRPARARLQEPTPFVDDDADAVQRCRLVRAHRRPGVHVVSEPQEDLVELPVLQGED